jgi:hypothetical protein
MLNETSTDKSNNQRYEAINNSFEGGSSLGKGPSPNKHAKNTNPITILQAP